MIELPLVNPELFLRVGIIPPKGCLLYGPPGTLTSYVHKTHFITDCIEDCEDTFCACLCGVNHLSVHAVKLIHISTVSTGTGKTLLARAVASQLDSNFLKVVSSAIVDKYIGESARLIREMFG